LGVIRAEVPTWVAEHHVDIFEHAGARHVVSSGKQHPAKPEYSSGVQASSELQTKPDWIELFLIQIKPTR
jgi:hypothetical protein